VDSISYLSAKNPFLSRVSILTRDIDIAILFVRLSVRLSDTLFYRNDLTYCHSFSSPHKVFWQSNMFANSDGALNTCGV